MTEGNATLGKVVRRHLDIDAVADEHADAVFPHLARGMRDDDVIIFKLNAEHSIREQLDHDTGKLRSSSFMCEINCPFYND